jgi:hypothetical protein
MPTEDEINNASDAFGDGLSNMGDTLSNKYAERVDPIGRAIAGFAESLFGNSAVLGSATPQQQSNPYTNTNISGQTGYGSPDALERRLNGYGLNPITGESSLSYDDALASIYDKYGSYSGGPNAAVLRSLNQGIQNKNKQYKQNSASVENMYGQLTQESEAAKQSILGSYEQAIGATGQRASALQNVLSQEGAAQEARRAGLAAQLGISQENALTQYSSQTRLNEAMGNILGQGQSWQGLLESQKLSAQQQADRMKTAIGNTKSATKLSLTEAYQNAINNYKNQIAQEKSKTATRTLDPLGQIQADVLLSQYKNELTGGTPAKWEQDEQDRLDRFSKTVVGRAVKSRNDPAYQDMLALAQEYYKNPQGGGAISEDVLTFMDIFQISPNDLYPSGANLFSSGIPKIGTGN